MNSQAPAQPPDLAARARLDRLENFLREDPGNAALLHDAFETALRAAEFERAEFHLRHALALRIDPWGWRLREGDLLLAQRRFNEAAVVLTALQAEPGMPEGLDPVLAHNLAYIDLQTGAYRACVDRLAPWVEVAHPASTHGGLLARGMQMAWLRSLHRCDERKRALQWAREADGAGQLDAAAAGVASLIALDEDVIDLAQRWSRRALEKDAADARPLEALNVQASLALGRSDIQQARGFSSAALQLQPEDGRTWSVLAFADMLEGDFSAATDRFQNALARMPEHIGTWHGLGWVQILQQRFTEGQATFEKALDMDRNFAESHGGLAVTLAFQGRVEEAQAHIERALRLDRRCLSAQYADAVLKGEVHDLERFRRLVQRLLGGTQTASGDAILDRVGGGLRRE